MNEPVATVEPDGFNAEKNAPRAEADQVPFGGGATSSARFAYASGSQPLAGYTIRRGVGHGGFGEVYYATSDAGKEVALKLIRRNLEIELRGIRHCLNLKHPNLLSVFDIREDGQGDKWVVMEYVTGQSLEAVVAAHPAGMPTEEALVWMHGIAAGVACLHDHGIVHRDLKPGNIFSDEGLVKVGDYGLSKFISCSRRSGQTESIGTVHYMAPEVANGRYGKEIDIYALGVILYEVLTGRVPFEGESVGEVLMKHLTAAPDVSMLEEPYRSVVARALEKDPARRFASVTEMLAALPVPARSQVRTGPLPSQVRDSSNAPTLPGGHPHEIQQADVPVLEVVDEEPIYRAVRQGYFKVQQSWNESKLNTPTKMVILVAGLFVALATAHTWFILLLMLLAMYGCYRVIRAVVLSLAPPRPPSHRYYGASPPAVRVPVAPLPPVPVHPAPPVRPAPRAEQESALWATLRKPLRHRVAELLGSMVGGALVAVTTCLVIVIINSFRTPQPMPGPGQFCWLMAVSVAGCWALLIPTKFWEGTRGEPMLRRLTLLVVGMGVGLAAFGVATYLQVDLPRDAKFGGQANYNLPASFYDGGGNPLPLAYVTVFGTLFALLRWWRQADPLRTTRISLWSMIFSIFLAWLIAELWLFPQPWLAMAACAISVSVQLASPWVHPRKRHLPQAT